MHLFGPQAFFLLALVPEKQGYDFVTSSSNLRSNPLKPTNICAAPMIATNAKEVQIFFLKIKIHRQPCSDSPPTKLPTHKPPIMDDMIAWKQNLHQQIEVENATMDKEEE